MCGGDAAKDRLKRLSEGKHPYKTYKTPSSCWAPWWGIGLPGSGLPPAITGQAELLALLRLNEEALELHLAGDLVGFAGLSGDADEEDPFGFDGDNFDS